MAMASVLRERCRFALPRFRCSPCGVRSPLAIETSVSPAEIFWATPAALLAWHEFRRFGRVFVYRWRGGAGFGIVRLVKILGRPTSVKERLWLLCSSPKASPSESAGRFGGFQP